MEVDDPEHEPGTVVRVVEDGYTIHDRLLRPARVCRRQAPRGPPTPSGAKTHSRSTGADRQ